MDERAELLQGEFPGKIAVADVRGSYPGNAIKTFTDHPSGGSAAEQMNDWFKGHPGRLVTMVSTSATYHPDFGTVNTITVLYTKQVTDEELKEMEELTVEVRKKIDERKVKQQEAELKAKEVEIKQQMDNRRLQGVGRKCEEDKHLEIIDDLRAKLKAAKKGK
jgi:hypothetical protein